MKYGFFSFIICYLLYDFINDPLRDILIDGEWRQLFDFIESRKRFLLFTSFNLSLLLYSLISYTGLYYFFPKKKYILCALIVIISILCPISIRYFLEQYLYEVIYGFANYKKGVSLLYYASDNYYYAIKYVSFGIIFFFIKYIFYREKQQKHMVIENQKMELSLLRSQINPHFLLNSMNNIYAMVYKNSDKSLQAIDMLSSVLKYSLYEQRDFVTLKEELSNVNKLIDLNRLKYDYDLAIETTIADGLDNVMIPPFLIIPLVENAFKHGNLKNASEPFTLGITAIGARVNVIATNKKSNHLKDKVGGIGLDNIKKRLEILYADNHYFEVSENSDTFTVTIKCPIK